MLWSLIKIVVFVVVVAVATVAAGLLIDSGSAVRIAYSGWEFTLGPLQATRSLMDRSSEPVTSTGGTLSGASTLWSGVVRVTSDVTVPTGHTLTIESNALILLDGVTSGTTANDLLVSGSIQSLGTELHPVTFTCTKTVKKP